MNKAQKNYTTKEREVLSIVETLKEFKGMLLGYKINIHTERPNLANETSLKASDRVMRWRLLLEEFGISTSHIKGENNVVADALSRLSIDETPGEINTYELMTVEEEFPMSYDSINKHQQAGLEHPYTVF